MRLGLPFAGSIGLLSPCRESLIMIYLAAAFTVMLIGWPLAIYAEGYAARQMEKEINK